MAIDSGNHALPGTSGIPDIYFTWVEETFSEEWVTVANEAEILRICKSLGPISLEDPEEKMYQKYICGASYPLGESKAIPSESVPWECTPGILQCSFFLSWDTEK